MKLVMQAITVQRSCDVSRTGNSSTDSLINDSEFYAFVVHTHVRRTYYERRHYSEVSDGVQSLAVCRIQFSRRTLWPTCETRPTRSPLHLVPRDPHPAIIDQSRWLLLLLLLLQCQNA